RRIRGAFTTPLAASGEPSTTAQYSLRARPSAKSACAAIRAARRSAMTRHPAVSASRRWASQGPLRRRESSGKRSSTLGPPRGPGCVGSPGGLSITTKRESRNATGGRGTITVFSEAHDPRHNKSKETKMAIPGPGGCGGIEVLVDSAPPLPHAPNRLPGHSAAVRQSGLAGLAHLHRGTWAETWARRRLDHPLEI